MSQSGDESTATPVPAEQAPSGSPTSTHGSSHDTARDEGADHGSAAATVATPDEAGRRVVLASFGTLNLLVIAAAGILRLNGRGAGAKKQAKQAARSVPPVTTGTTRTDDHFGGNA